jgi:hypothetical protein
LNQGPLLVLEELDVAEPDEFLSAEAIFFGR